MIKHRWLTLTRAAGHHTTGHHTTGHHTTGHHTTGHHADRGAGPPDRRPARPTRLRASHRLALVERLRVDDQLTATQAAAKLNESVANCSFHLRQLAKYGLVEPADGGKGREKPWRATAMTTERPWDADTPTPRDTNHVLATTVLDRHTAIIRTWLARHDTGPAEWRALTGFSDAIIHLTPQQLTELTSRLDAVLSEYQTSGTDPEHQSAQARQISIVRLTLPHV